MEAAVFEIYQDRKIELYKLLNIAQWQLKIYTITNREYFSSSAEMELILQALPTWLAEANKAPIPIYRIGFLFVHEAREGIWVLLNWWTGGEMIQTKIYFIDPSQASVIKTCPYNTDGLVCIWELEIIAHERRAWIEHVLMQAGNPDFEAYLQDTY